MRNSGPGPSQRGDPASSKWMPWANQTSGPSQPTESMYSTGVIAKRSRQKSCSSRVSARWVCSRTPLSRASTAASRSRSPVTEKGEHGATPMRSIESGPGSWCVSTAAAVAARMSSSSPRHGPAGGPPGCARGPSTPEWRGTATRPSRGLDLGAQDVAAVARKHVVVVHRRRAPAEASQPSPAEAAAADDVLVDAAPHRIELGEPPEQGRVDGQPTGGPLVEVVVGVDQPRRATQPVASTTTSVVTGIAVVATCADRDDPCPVDDDVARRHARCGRGPSSRPCSRPGRAERCAPWFSSPGRWSSRTG